MKPAPPSPYIAARAYDWVFFLLPPSLGLALAALLAWTGWSQRGLELQGKPVSYVELTVGALIHAHLAAVLVRSHGRRELVRRHPVRMLAVPPALFALLYASPAARVVASVAVVYWDVYHSAMQTFGLGRSYERRAGNDPEAGRRLDLALNLALYVGPIVAGATFLDHAEHLAELRDAGWDGAARAAAALAAHRSTLAAVGAAITAGILVTYVAGYVNLARAGHRVGVPKVFLLSTTGLCSLVAWSLNPWGLAFAIMNFFHAVQYLALVWWTEGRGRLGARPWAARLAPLAYLAVLLGYGWVADRATADGQLALWAAAQTVALLHFWYDGFVWSVRRAEL